MTGPDLTTLKTALVEAISAANLTHDAFRKARSQATPRHFLELSETGECSLCYGEVIDLDALAAAVHSTLIAPLEARISELEAVIVEGGSRL